MATNKYTTEGESRLSDKCNNLQRQIYDYQNKLRDLESDITDKDKQIEKLNKDVKLHCDNNVILTKQRERHIKRSNKLEKQISKYKHRIEALEKRYDILNLASCSDKDSHRRLISKLNEEKAVLECLYNKAFHLALQRFQLVSLSTDDGDIANFDYWIAKVQDESKWMTKKKSCFIILPKKSCSRLYTLCVTNTVIVDMITIKIQFFGQWSAMSVKHRRSYARQNETFISHGLSNNRQKNRQGSTKE